MARIDSDTVNIPSINLEEQSSTPATPAAGRRRIYGKSDGVYHVDSSGTAEKLASGDMLEDIAALTPSDGLMIVGDGSGFVGESGATLRTSIGVGTGNSPTFAGLTLSGLTASKLVATDGAKALTSLADSSGLYAIIAGWWSQDDVAASQSAVALALAESANRTELPMPRAGSVVGIAVYSNAARSAGTLTVDVCIDGSVTGLQAVLDGSNTQTHYATQAIGIDDYTAGQRIGVKITTDGDWSPTTADIIVVVEVAPDA